MKKTPIEKFRKDVFEDNSFVGLKCGTVGRRWFILVEEILKDIKKRRICNKIKHINLHNKKARQLDELC